MLVPTLLCISLVQNIVALTLMRDCVPTECPKNHRVVVKSIEIYYLLFFRLPFIL